MAGRGNFLVSAERADKALREFIRVIEDTGGVRVDPTTGLYAPVADPEWVDLGEAYITACGAMGWPPEVGENDPDCGCGV